MSASLVIASTFTAWRRVRITGVACAKLGAKKPTSARCGSLSRSLGRRTGWEGMSRRSKVASHSAVVRAGKATASMS